VVSQVGELPTAPTTFKGTYTCNTSGGSVAASWSQNVDNLKCLAVTSGSGKTATITVGSDGTLSCAVS
jgi:hypothetical protein